MAKTVVQCISIQDKTSASRRIRYKTFLKYLPKSILRKKYKKTLDCDVLYIQKLIRNWTLGVARKAKARGIPVIFDLDDIRENWKDKPYDKMFSYCTAITTDTEEKAVELRKHTDLPVHVIPDTIDYNAIEEIPLRLRESLNRPVTFGRWQNVANVPEFTSHCSYICDRKVLGFKGAYFKWNPDNFLYLLKDHDYAILSHHEHWAVDMKSNNRLLVCMAIGLPAITSRCKAYVDTLEEMGLGWLATDKEGFQDTVKRLKEEKKIVAKKFYAHARENYHPEKSSKLLAELIENVKR